MLTDFYQDLDGLGPDGANFSDQKIILLPIVGREE